MSFAEEHETFDDEGSSVSDKGKGVDWGDVAPGRLRAKGQDPPFSTQVRMENLPVKLHVVERHPRVLRSPEPPTPEGDSDDESVSESVVDADSEDGEVMHQNDASESEDERHQGPLQSESDDDNDDLPTQDHDDWGGEDFDYARHQREVALEYYEKRKTVGAEVAGAMRAHSHDDDGWDQPVSYEEHLIAQIRLMAY